MLASNLERHLCIGETVAGLILLWNPSLLGLDELLDQLSHSLLVECGQSNALAAPVQTGHVHVWSEKADATVIVAISLHSFETLEGIVEDA